MQPEGSVVLAQRVQQTDTHILHADSTETIGLQYRGVDLSGTTTAVSGAVALANGGTGQTTKALAFDALSPLNEPGDLLVGGADGTGMRLPVSSTVGDILTSNGTTAAWTTPSNAGTVFEIEAYTGSTPWTVSAMSDPSKMGKIFTIPDAGTVVLPDATTFGLKFLYIQLLSPPTSSRPIVINATDTGGHAVLNHGSTPLDDGDILWVLNKWPNLNPSYRGMRMYPLKEGLTATYNQSCFSPTNLLGQLTVWCVVVQLALDLDSASGRSLLRQTRIATTFSKRLPGFRERDISGL
jgi:hypothetical protein